MVYLVVGIGLLLALLALAVVFGRQGDEEALPRIDIKHEAPTIEPRFVGAATVAASEDRPALPHREVPEIGAVVAYWLGSQETWITDRHLEALDLDLEAVHQLCEAFLRQQVDSRAIRGLFDHPEVLDLGPAIRPAAVFVLPEELEPGQELLCAVPEAEHLLVAAASPEALETLAARLAAAADPPLRVVVRATPEGLRAAEPTRGGTPQAPSGAGSGDAAS